MNSILKPGRRVRFHDIKGTITAVFPPTPPATARRLVRTGFSDQVQRRAEYVAIMDNGVVASGTKHQFKPVRG